MMARLSPSEKLLWALIENNNKDMKNALHAGADANTSSPTGSRPLHAAALRGSASLIKMLVQHKAKVDQADTSGFTPLMVAALNGRTDAVTALLKKGANSKLTRLDTGETALHMAMAGGSPGVVRALVDGGADINAQTTVNKFTPLHFAAQFDAGEISKILLGNPLCNAEIKDTQGRTPTDLARDEGHFGLAEHLDTCTGDKNENDKKLVSAVVELDEGAARAALKDGANATGSRPLHTAALRGSVTLINMLVQHKAKVDQADTSGFTPLMVAALNGRTDAVTALLEKGANPNLTRPDTGETALHMAMAGGSPGVVRALVGGGADINAQTTVDNFTPLHFAAKFNAPDLIEELKKHPHCNINLHDARSRTAAQLSEELDHRDTSSRIKWKVWQPQDPMPPSDIVYKVLTLPRGTVLILNYKHFLTHDHRAGAEKDAVDLKTLFDKMGYEVAVHTDKTKQETKKELEKLLDEGKLEKVDCVVVCLLSYGASRNTFFTSDGKQMTVEEVYDYFTDDNCHMLKGKPKLFLFDFTPEQKKKADSSHDMRAGSEYTGGVSTKSSSENDASPPMTRTTVLRDRVSIYSNAEGMKSNGAEDTGSFFVHSTVKIFDEYAHILDVQELASKVNSLMVNEMAGTTIYTDCTTTKKFYLNPVTRK